MFEIARTSMLNMFRLLRQNGIKFLRFIDFSLITNRKLRARFIKLCGVYIGLFMGIGILSALIKLANTRIETFIVANYGLIGSNYLVALKVLQILAEVLF